MCYKKTKEHYPEHKLGKLTKHHLIPTSKGGANVPENISHVPEKLHQAFHLLFCNHLPNKIAQTLNEHWIDRNKTMIVIENEYLEKVKDFIAKISMEKY